MSFSWLNVLAVIVLFVGVVTGGLWRYSMLNVQRSLQRRYPELITICRRIARFKNAVAELPGKSQRKAAFHYFLLVAQTLEPVTKRKKMEQSSDNRAIPMTSVNSGKLREVTPDVAYYTNQIVNLIMIGKPGGEWVLIDAGMPKSGDEIIRATEERFGIGNAPSAIILTHGHFDHVGSIVDLVLEWNVPVYAHTLEFPFLTGEQAYPEPDTSVEGGMLAKISSYYPNEPTDISEALQTLPPDGSVPFLPGWEWIHVPGHAPGQVALFRKQDRLLISADAFVTVQQDSMYKVLVQKKEVCGPPVYLTTDWEAAYQSVKQLADLAPAIAITGHGTAVEGEELRAGLENLVTNWEEVAVPEHGKWVREA